MIVLGDLKSKEKRMIPEIIRNLGVFFESKRISIPADFRIYFVRSDEEFKHVLIQKCGLSEEETRGCEEWYAVSFPEKKSIVVDIVKEENALEFTLSHELGHFVMGILIGLDLDAELKDSIIIDWWILEGFADYLAFRFIDEHSKYYCYKKGQYLDIKQDALERCKKISSISLDELVEKDNGWRIMKTCGDPWAPFSYMFLAVDYLVEEKGLQALFHYFRLFSKCADSRSNFKRAFGFTFEEFLADCPAFLREKS